MTYDLFIGDRLFSSWSLRGWLMLHKFDLPYRTHAVDLYGTGMAEQMATLAPARLVPALRTPEGEVIGETLAIAETLAERHPEAGLWPGDATARSRARWLCAEMTAGFAALRGTCPMQIAHVETDFKSSDAVLADLARIETLWSFARERAGDGPWLFGTCSLADVFYAPVCARIVGHGLPVSRNAERYCLTTLDDPAFRQWRAAALEKTYTPFPYPPVGGTKSWPV
jgi:glutathione S-transferase